MTLPVVAVAVAVAFAPRSWGVPVSKSARLDNRYNRGSYLMVIPA